VCEIATANLRKYKSSGSDQIATEPFQAGGEIYRSKFHKLINSLWVRKCLGGGRSFLLYSLTRRAIKFHAKVYPHPSLKLKFLCRRNYWGSSMWFSMLTDQLLFRSFAFLKYGENVRVQ
jgi:hypothetical protein